MKGFDYLEPEGFYNALQAYSFPNSISQFDHSAQTDMPYRVKTSHGLTPSFVVSSITKQGGPLSPLKSTLTTSLGNCWATDLSVGDPYALCISSNLHCAPHLPPHAYTLLVTMVEAMDDSLFFFSSLPSL